MERFRKTPRGGATKRRSTVTVVSLAVIPICNSENVIAVGTHEVEDGDEGDKRPSQIVLQLLERKEPCPIDYQQWQHAPQGTTGGHGITVRSQNIVIPRVEGEWLDDVFYAKNPLLFPPYFAHAAVQKMFFLAERYLPPHEFDAFVGAVLLEACGYTTREIAEQSMRYLAHRPQIGVEFRRAFGKALDSEDVTWDIIVGAALGAVREPREPLPEAPRLSVHRIEVMIAQLRFCAKRLREGGMLPEALQPLLVALYGDSDAAVVHEALTNPSTKEYASVTVAERMDMKRADVEALLKNVSS